MSSGRLKIALVTVSMTEGGTQRVAATLANAWVKAGHTVQILTFEPQGTRPDFPLSEDVALVQLDLMRRSGNFLRSFANNVHRARVLRRRLRAFSPDVALAMLAGPNVLTVLAGWRRSWPTVISERAHPAHHPPERIWKLLRRLIYPRAAAIVVQTNEIAEWFKTKLGCEAPVIANPIDLEKFSLTAFDRRADKPCFSVIAVGRLDRQKGFDLLIDAFARAAAGNPQWNLTIYGEGPDRALLQGLIDSCGLADRILLAGNSSDIAGVYTNADLFVHSARYEGYPNAIQEALATGLPVIATDCPGATRELLADGRYGVLVPSEDVASLAHALASNMPNFEARAALARSAREAVLAFDVNRIAERWIELFRDLINQRNRR